MGKKTKVGKQRKDKYYQLAKETGYRSRAAFKLIQLNRKFGFLQKSRVCIDLCAAPGGWMQVAQQNMPLSSIVVGVDLFPIKPVPGCIALTEDITTDKCRSAISKEIKTWKADVVLHDGAPNVGQNWLHDAYQQASLTLSALKLATQFLREGGWFISKVFRSKDYHSLLWVFKQLFKKVHATKPQASRNESSEIFVVCQGYIAPDSIDPKFLDQKHVFEDFDTMNKSKVNLMHPERQKKAKAEGYEQDDYTQFHPVPLSVFLAKDDPLEALQGCSQITLDDTSIEQHSRTTNEIKECCKDIKVLGRKDLKSLLSWIKQMKEFKASQVLGTKKDDNSENNATAENNKNEDEEDKDNDEDVDTKIAELENEERRMSKRKRKQINKQRQKLAEKMNLKMVIKGDDGPIMESHDMFQLKDIKDAKELDAMIDQQPDLVAEESEPSDDELRSKPKYMKYDVESTKLDSSGTYYKDSDSEIEMESESEDETKETLGLSDSEDDEKKVAKITKKNTVINAKSVSKKNPLLTDLDPTEPKSRRAMKAELWFQKDSLKDLAESDDEDVDLDKLAHTYKKKGKKVAETALSESQRVKVEKNGKPFEKDSGHSSGSSDSDSESESGSDYDVEREVAPAAKGGTAAGDKDSFEVVPQDAELKRLKRTLKMDAEALALGTMMATSKKFKRDVIDDGWNRYMFDDKNLPDWFAEDEKKNMRKPIAVPESKKDEYETRFRAIDARPIKKVVEAKARKKKRMQKKMERAKKKVESVMENADMPEREKAKQIKQLYKKASTDGKKKLTYVVAKKHTTAKRMKRPSNVKGRYRVVDPRMKKDMRAQKAQDKKVKKNQKNSRSGKKKGKKAK